VGEGEERGEARRYRRHASSETEDQDGIARSNRGIATCCYEYSGVFNVKKAFEGDSSVSQGKRMEREPTRPMGLKGSPGEGNRRGAHKGGEKRSIK